MPRTRELERHDIVYKMDSFPGSKLSATDQLFRSFDSHLRRRGRAESTRRQYSYALRPFELWLGTRAVGDLSVADIELFLAQWEADFQLRRGRLPRPATMRGTIGALRVFFGYLEQADLLAGADGSPCRNPLRSVHAPSCPQRSNDFLRPYEDRAILSVEVPHHHRVIVWLLRYTGLRVAEAQALTLDDVDLTPGGEALEVRHSKTPAGSRVIPLLPQLLPLIEERFGSEYRISGRRDLPLLATRHGTAVTTNYMWRVVKRVAYEAGVRPVVCTCGTSRQDRHDRGCPRTTSGENRSTVSPHTLRRSFATDLINRGVRLETVSRLLGHSSSSVTERSYAQLLGPTIRTEFFEAFERDLAGRRLAG